MLNDVAKESFQRIHATFRCKSNAAQVVYSDIVEAFKDNQELRSHSHKIMTAQLKTYKTEFEAALLALQNKIVQNSTLSV